LAAYLALLLAGLGVAGASAQPCPSQTLTFQQGDGGPHSQTHGAIIWVQAPTTNYGSDLQMLTNAQAQFASRSLVRFPELFGPLPGQVPPGSTIVSATLGVINHGRRPWL
jgi:hypothetical protein